MSSSARAAAVALVALLAGACGGADGGGVFGGNGTGASTSSTSTTGTSGAGGAGGHGGATTTTTSSGTTTSGTSGTTTSTTGTGQGGAGPCNPALCQDAVPAGWTRVGLAQSPGVSCGAGLQAVDVVEAPTPEPGACTCGPCTITKDPSCAQGTIKTWFDTGNGKCGQAGLNVDGTGACHDIQNGAQLQAHFAGAVPKASGGACTADATPDQGKVATQAERFCELTPGACEADLCSGALTECIRTKGDVSCPAGPFTVKHVVGTGVTLACGACDCTTYATCTGTLDLYQGNGCNGASLSLASDGTCYAPGGGGTIFKSYAFQAEVASKSCKAAKQAAADVSLEGVHTACCKP
jgi:hypothetical protein